MTPREAASVLAAAGVASPDHDARALLRHARSGGGDYDELVRRRAAREPLQHLVGSAGFRYLELAVGAGVFVPRPETELVVEAVLAEVRGRERPLVVDLCAGSGAIGLSVAHECPGSVVHLVERDAVAFGWLSRNAAVLAPGVHLHHDDLAAAPAGVDGEVDVVVSNPPYVADGERLLLEPEVVDHDPPQALFAGHDGLAVIRAVAVRAAQLLRPGGLLVVEHSDRQGESVPALLHRSGCWREVADHRDLTDRPRFATARLQE